jgi:cell wall-associated NlpC family hydrolase
MTELERSAELIERLLGDPELRRRFRSDPATVLAEAGLPQLAAGLGERRRSMMTLELRESRSSLAGVLVAAAAEGVDFAQFADHAMPALAHDAGRAMEQMVDHPAKHPHPAAHHVSDVKPPKPSMGPPAEIPALAPRAPVHHPDAAAQPAAPAPAQQPAAAPAAAPPASSTAAPTEGAKMTISPAARAPAHHPDPAAADGRRDHHPNRASTPAEPPPAPTPPDPALDYPGDAASPQALAAWMGAHAQQAGLPPELPVMAALTESGLRNLNYGDRDSVGFFQMRLGIWDEGPYAGYPDHPQLQIQWFIDHALAVRSQEPALAQSPSSWGEWVADVEQPAAQYRYRYQLQLEAAQQLLQGAELAPAAGSVAPVSVGQAALDAALHLARHPSAAAGVTFQAGVSPAGLVQYAYAHQGVQLPQAAAEQFEVGIPVGRHALKPGDAVFFAEPDGLVDRVGLYVGRGHFVTAARRGGDVKVSALDDPGFAARYVGARRYSAQALGDHSSYARPLPTVKR